MKKLYSSPDNTEVELLKNILTNAGIPIETRNQDVSTIIPALPFYEELWVSDEDYAKASEVIADVQKAPALEDSWKCPACGELVDAQFGSCWKCGTTRPVTRTT